MNIRNKRRAKRMPHGLCMVGGIPIDITVPEWMKKHSCSLAAEIFLRKGNKEEAVEILTERLRKQRGVRDEEYLLGLIRLLYMSNQLERALDVILEYMQRKTKKARHPYIQKLRMLLEGHVYYARESLVGSKIWCKSALVFLQKRFDFDVAVLYMEISRKILQEEEKHIEASLFSAVDIKNEEYLCTAYNPKELKSLLEFLERRGAETKTVKRAYIRRNPLLDKAELLAYFKENRDPELLQYVLERRPVKELRDYAIRENVYTREIEARFEGVKWEDALLRMSLSKKHAPPRLSGTLSGATGFTADGSFSQALPLSQAFYQPEGQEEAEEPERKRERKEDLLLPLLPTQTQEPSQSTFSLYKNSDQETDHTGEESSDLDFLAFLKEE